ncbi:MAG: hypothetical protein CSA62_10560 [Planctomycetota bacterium]|nr:MAG: hypothetical protein CSA62_10560 [Planctomycetota bacterium]
MISDKKKKAIILAAASAYLRRQRAAATLIPMKRPEASAWGLSGRQETMQVTMMIQRRMWQRA